MTVALRNPVAKHARILNRAHREENYRPRVELDAVDCFHCNDTLKIRVQGPFCTEVIDCPHCKDI